MPTEEVLANNNAGKVFFQNGRTVIWYEAQDIDPHDFPVGASLPEKYITGSLEKQTPSPTSATHGSSAVVTVLVIIFFAVILLFIIGIFIVIARVIKKAKYIAPELAMESLGARKDLDAVEAAVVLEAHPFKLINILLLSLVKKGRMKIVDWKPVRCEILPEKEKMESFSCPNCGAPQKIVSEKQICEYCGTEIVISGRLAYYENDFLLHGIKKEGTLDEEGLKLLLKSLVEKVNEKMRGYSRPETQKFYKDQIEKYWGNLRNVSEEERFRLFGRSSSGSRQTTGSTRNHLMLSRMWILPSIHPPGGYGITSDAALFLEGISPKSSTMDFPPHRRTSDFPRMLSNPHSQHH